MLREANVMDFVGKIISMIDLSCSNVWKIKFSDGMKIEIWAEGFSKHNIPILLVDDDQLANTDEEPEIMIAPHPASSPILTTPSPWAATS